MDASEALSTAAQVAVTIAGFTGVVIAVAAGPIHQWSHAQLFRLKMLVATSVSPLIWSLVGLSLLATDLRPPTVWTWCSGLASVMLVIGWSTAVRNFAQLDMQALGRGGHLTFYSASGIGLAALALQVYNIGALHAFWPFFAMVTIAMALSSFQFVRMTLDSPRRPGGDARSESAG
jgi:hypothetical protein